MRAVFDYGFYGRTIQFELVNIRTASGCKRADV